MIKVIARSGVRVPMEENGRRYITDAEGVEVARSAYYLRRLREGDLQPVSADVKHAAPDSSEGTVSADNDIPVVEAVKRGKA